VLAKVELQQDPQADKAERRSKDRVSLRSIVAEYLETKRDKLRPKTYKQAERYLLSGLHFKSLHNMPIDQVSQRDVARCLLDIAKRGNATAVQARKALSAFFVWSMKMGLATANPVINTESRASKPRERVLSDPELIAVWRACGDDHFGKIVKLLILTAARRTEVGGMCWSELDDSGNWTIPAARSKNDRAHTLPLPQAALDIIASVPLVLDRDQLFGGRGAHGYANWNKAKRLLDERSGVSDWLLHDLRRTAATRMADIGVQPHIIEAILNHYSGHRAGPAGIYNRSSYQREVRAALALWADHITALVTGGARKVIALPTK
jgi:integrase